jgi:indole-3-glycerol phosphate synthase
MAAILDTIVDDKRHRVARLKRDGIVLPKDFAGSEPPPPRGFHRSLMEEELAIIAEVKKASPSKGVICEDFDPVAIARNYQSNGARAISVLTDEKFFQGALRDLMQVRAATTLPVLRKDFIIDGIQIQEAAMHGADAILLIAAILEVKELGDLRLQAEELGLDALVEVHDERETEMALAAGSRVIGINNRNLNDFSVDLETTFRLKKLIPSAIPVVSESGLATAEDFARLREQNIAAALVGESLMRAGKDSPLLAQLRGAAGGR